MGDVKLLPCPFCGTDDPRPLPPTCRPETPYNPADRLYPIVMCRLCGAVAAGENEDYKGATAAAAWNLRAAPPSGGDERAPIGANVYVLRCGWCGAYEGTVDRDEPCARDAGSGDYIGPHQFAVYEPVARSLQEGPRETPIGWVVVEDQGVAVGAKFVYGSSDDETMDALMTREDAERLAEALRERAQTGLTYTVEPVGSPGGDAPAERLAAGWLSEPDRDGVRYLHSAPTELCEPVECVAAAGARHTPPASEDPATPTTEGGAS